jgi:hypothetical protein
MLYWNDFKIKLNEIFTSHNRILKGGQELLNLHQGEGLDALVHYVKTFSSLLNHVLMKEKYSSKVTFLHCL